MSETLVPRPPWKSLETLGKSAENVEKCSETLVFPLEYNAILENLWKSSESGRKSSENCQKRHHVYNKQNITCPLVDMNFIFLCSTQHLTRALRSLMRY